MASTRKGMRNIPIAFVAVAVFAGYCTEAFIGMNWGRQSAQRLVPSQVVDLMLQNGIRNVRIYTTQFDILQAFEGSGVNLTITFFNQTMPPSQKNATDWVQWKYPVLYTSNVRTMILGSIYVFDQGAPGIPPIDFAMNSLNYLQTALNEAGLGSRMKANFIHYSGILVTGRSRKPSTAEFRPDITDKMVEFLQYLHENDAPFLLEIYPILDIELFGLDPTFAFPDGTSSLVIHDVNGADYTNMFHLVYDCFVWALEKLNASDVKIVVSAIGWPTDGYVGASAANAERFYKYLLPMVASNKGTPKRPGSPIDVYVNTLTDEPKMSFVRPFTRHWGVYRSNGEPKYKIDLSGQGRDIYPTEVKGIMRMPNRWCVFNGDTTDMNKVNRMVERACAQGDCTTLAPGASCSKLSVEKNVSYAFNVFFQTSFQDADQCDFEGIASVTDQDPSTEECVFPVEVVRGQQLNNFQSAACEGPHGRPDRVVFVFVFVVSISWGLIWS